MKYYLSILFFAAVFSSSAQKLEEHSFYFKGYRLELKSVAMDGSGNYLFNGMIKDDDSITEKDTMIQSQVKLYEEILLEDLCIVIQTDATFTIKNIFIFSAIHPTNIVYDKKNDLFWFGISWFGYTGRGESLSSSWQMNLIKFDLNSKSQAFHPIELNFSCRMQEIVLLNDNLACIGIKDTLSGEEQLETPVIVEVSNTHFHKNANLDYLKSPDVLSTTISTVESATHVDLTECIVDKNGFYFIANRFPFGQTPTLGVDLYYYENGKLTFKPFRPSQKTKELYYATNIQLMNDGNLLVSYVPEYDGKYFILEKLSPKLDLISSITVPDLQYPDFQNELVVLPNGKIITAGLNASKNWSYFVYSNDGKLEKEFDTQQPKNLHIGFTKALNDNDFIFLFYSSSKSVPNQFFIYSSK